MPYQGNCDDDTKTWSRMEDATESTPPRRCPLKLKLIASGVASVTLVSAVYVTLGGPFIQASELKDNASPADLATNSVQPNMRPGLKPSQGLWRGTTHWPPSMAGLPEENYDPLDFKNEFGVPAHIYRSFKSPGGEALTDGESGFVKKGGILWYGFQPTDWKEAASSTFEAQLKKYAKVVQDVAPAQVMVAPGWEPDGHAAPLATGQELFGTTDDYKAFYANTVKVFKDMGVSNAIFIVDFSQKCLIDSSYCDVIPEIFPSDGSVGWLFFNIFQTADKKMYENQVKHNNAHANWDSVAQLDEFYNLFTSHQSEMGIGSIPWGLGAWGTLCQNKATPPAPLNPEDRKTFISNLGAAFASGKYPKMKAEIYFDSLYDIITPYDVTITGKGDIAHNNAVATYPTSSELVGTYEDFLNLNIFTGNDAGYHAKR